ncbi:hypothetical protein DSM106972_076770 [Dulcicalothrix desertica PCC 7102]|uniref:Uncharacterized protein n=1 Tax=Dulcicalothrix desertica PCC 7102 TaxID=232991 RepID=A0A433V2C9_9CYAN|nr:hypothetical protein [Dulcicalothrix desertica]RUT00229.1 hypothetical protein DSM106972_076770 [Dulcicalothrix desertica PCC 7102]TWH55696.1 hypothetical protein CAL7102_03859 [Dulcicalothrix desertica PCC 7102]
MLSTKFGINFINTSTLFNFLATRLKAKRIKTHDYTNQVSGQDYVFETIDDHTKGYMTAQGKGVTVGDFITLQDGAEVYHYQVEQIEYYSNPSDMWTGVLKRV